MTRHKMDALNVCGNIYRMNAPHAIGYLYNPTQDGREVAEGMYCDLEEEIDPERWTYFYYFKDKTFYDLECSRSLKTLRNKL